MWWCGGWWWGWGRRATKKIEGWWCGRAGPRPRAIVANSTPHVLAAGTRTRVSCAHTALRKRGEVGRGRAVTGRPRNDQPSFDLPTPTKPQSERHVS